MGGGVIVGKGWGGWLLPPCALPEMRAQTDSKYNVVYDQIGSLASEANVPKTNW